MAHTISPHQALIYVMVTMAGVDRAISDKELQRIGRIVQTLPAFDGFDPEKLVFIAQECGEMLQEDDGLSAVLGLIQQDLPPHLHECAYALAVEVAAVDLAVQATEIRFLAMLRDRFDMDKLTTAAIERGAQARLARV
ncbi:MAG: tellurite resistance TerB family protein [Hyphomicrobiales bacterium]